MKFAQNITYHPDHCTISSTSFKHSENLSRAYHICDNKKRIIKESIKSVLNKLIDAKTPFTIRTIKEILEDKLKSDISKISIIKLLKEELNLSYK